MGYRLAAAGHSLFPLKVARSQLPNETWHAGPAATLVVLRVPCSDLAR